MVNNNKTYKQKLGDAVVRTGAGLWWVVATVVCTAIVLVCVAGKEFFVQGEKLATKSQEYSANKAVENFVQANEDSEEAFNLYLEGSDEKVELPVDEGYSSGSERNNSKLPSSKKVTA